MPSKLLGEFEDGNDYFCDTCKRILFNDIHAARYANASGRFHPLRPAPSADVSQTAVPTFSGLGPKSMR